MMSNENKWASVTEELEQKDIMRANKLIQMLEAEDAVNNIPKIEKEFDKIQQEWKHRIITSEFVTKLYRSLEALKFAKAHNDGIKTSRGELFQELIDKKGWEPVQAIWSKMEELEEKYKGKIPETEIKKLEKEYKKSMEYIMTEIGVGYQSVIEREFEKRIRIYQKRLERSVKFDFSTWLHSARKQKGYTLKELADKAGISVSYIHRFEKNQRRAPSVPIVVKLATALDYDPTMVLNMIGQGADSLGLPSKSEPVELLDLLNVSSLKVGGKTIGTVEKNLLVSIVEQVVQEEWEDEDVWTEGKDLFVKIVKLQKKLNSKKK